MRNAPVWTLLESLDCWRSFARSADRSVFRAPPRHRAAGGDALCTPGVEVTKSSDGKLSSGFQKVEGCKVSDSYQWKSIQLPATGLQSHVVEPSVLLLITSTKQPTYTRHAFPKPWQSCIKYRISSFACVSTTGLGELEDTPGLIQGWVWFSAVTRSCDTVTRPTRVLPFSCS